MEFARTFDSGGENLKVPLAWSALMHVVLGTLLVISTLRSHRGEIWGGAGGGAITVGLVGSLPGVPLPRPDVTTTSRVVDQSKGLYREEPKPPESKADAAELPEFERNKPPKYVSRPSKVLEDPTPPPQGAIPYGQGGTPSLPYTQFSMGGGTEGALGFSGPGGAFAERYPWYVEAVRRKISSNWLYSTIDPRVHWAPRVVVTFQILRNGSIVNIEVLRSSGNESVDRSAVRAILSSNPVEPLPTGYAGSYVQVEFWFDFRRQ
jgi:protein TonB